MHAVSCLRRFMGSEGASLQAEAEGADKGGGTYCEPPTTEASSKSRQFQPKEDRAISLAHLHRRCKKTCANEGLPASNKARLPLLYMRDTNTAQLSSSLLALQVILLSILPSSSCMNAIVELSTV
eukprot:6364136-Pyramimonas_sp.AAC.1